MSSLAAPPVPDVAPPGGAGRPARGRRWAAWPVEPATLVRIAAFAGFVALASARWSDETNTYLVTACTTVLVAAGLHVLIHWSGQVSLGQVAFIGVGGFVAAKANADWGMPTWSTLLVAALAGCAASLVLGLPALRIRGFPLAITTLAAAYAADRWLFHQEWLAGSGIGIAYTDLDLVGFDTTDPGAFLVPIAVLTGLVVVAVSWLGRSALGHSMRMVAADEEVAASYGIHVGVHKLLAFVVAGSTAALAGAVSTMGLGRASVEMFPVQQSIVYVSAVLLGGRGSVRGSVVAAASLIVLPELFDAGRYSTLVGSVGLVLAVRFLPGGINSLAAHRRGPRRGWAARRAGSADAAA